MAVFEKFFALETWERLDWLNQKWNKTKEEKADIVKSAGAFPLVLMSVIMFDWILGAIIFNISTNHAVRVVAGIGPGTCLLAWGIPFFPGIGYRLSAGEPLFTPFDVGNKRKKRKKKA